MLEKLTIRTIASLEEVRVLVQEEGPHGVALRREGHPHVAHRDLDGDP